MKNYWQAINNRFFLDAHAGDISVGLVGVGGWGKANAIALMKTKRFKIGGAFDIDQSISRQFSQRYKTQRYHSYSEILANQDIRAVVLTVPNQLHFSMAKQAIEAGKHVFVEKPLAVTKKECLDLGDLSTREKKILMVGHQMRREPAFRTIKEIVKKNKLGKPIFAHGIRTLLRKNKDWRRDPLACPGGSMEQLGIHFMDTMIYLFGQPITWHGWGKNIPFIHETSDWGHIEMHFSHNVSGVVDSSFSSPSQMDFTLFCEEGQLYYNGKKLEMKKANSKQQRISLKGAAGNELQFVEFADCIVGGQKPETDVQCSVLLADILSSLKRKENEA